MAFILISIFIGVGESLSVTACLQRTSQDFMHDSTTRCLIFWLTGFFISSSFFSLPFLSSLPVQEFLYNSCKISSFCLFRIIITSYPFLITCPYMSLPSSNNGVSISSSSLSCLYLSITSFPVNGAAVNLSFSFRTPFYYNSILLKSIYFIIYNFSIGSEIY